MNFPINEEAVRRTAHNIDPFPCDRCGERIETSKVEVVDISPYVIQSTRRGFCQGCGEEAEIENRFYEGQIARKVDGIWLVALVVPSGIDRIRDALFRS